MILGVALTKSVFIHNRRLWVVQTLFRICIAVGIAAKFYLLQEWAKSREISLMGVALRVKDPSLPELSHEYHTFANRRVCTNPRNFTKSSDGTMTAPPSCVPVCSGSSAPCVHSFHTHTQVSSTEVMLNTHIRQTITNAEGTGPTRSGTNDFLVPSTLGLSLFFSYGFEIDGRVSTIATNIKTQLQKQGQTISTKGQCNFIELSVRELLNMADADDLLGDGEAQNLFMDGVELRLKVSCSNVELSAPKCTVSVEKSPLPWVMMRRTDGLFNGTFSHFETHGIRVVALAKGNDRILDFAVLLNAFIGSLVLISLPGHMVFIMAKYTLGHLSHVYRAVIREDFDLIQQLAGMATRLMVSSVAFLDLQDDECCISQEILHERLGDVFEGLEDQLGFAEVDRLCDFCFDGIVAGKKADTIIELLKESKMSLENLCDEEEFREKSAMAKTKISKKHFNVAFSSIEQVSFEDVIGLFDVKRPRPLLERFFTPPQITKYVFHKFDEAGGTNSSVPSRPSRTRSLTDLTSIQDTLEAKKSAIWDSATLTKDLMLRVESLESKVEDQNQFLAALQDSIKSGAGPQMSSVCIEAIAASSEIIENTATTKDAVSPLQDQYKVAAEHRATIQKEPTKDTTGSLQVMSVYQETTAKHVPEDLYDNQLIRTLRRDSADMFNRLAKLELWVHQSSQAASFVAPEDAPALPLGSLSVAKGFTASEGTEENHVESWRNPLDATFHRITEADSTSISGISKTTSTDGLRHFIDDRRYPHDNPLVTCLGRKVEWTRSDHSWAL